MTYSPNIPQANDIISESQGDLLANFGQIDDGVSAGIANDHISLLDGTATNRGRHRRIRFVQQAADPTTPASQIALYTKDVSGTPRLFIREQSDGIIYQLNAGTPSNANPGHSWLPGGLLIKFGSFASVASTLQTLTYDIVGPPVPPAFSAPPYSVQAIISSSAGAGRVFINVRQGTNAATGVQFNTVDQNNNAVSAGRTIYWVAIGPS